MSEEEKKKTAKGGRKGGRQFPQITLKQAVEYSKKLVSKTHTGAQAEGILLTGVFGSGTSNGKIRASAMKQFGLMDGTADAYIASDLAKKIVAAPADEIRPLLHVAALKPDIFKSLYETFKGDQISFAKIRQQGSNLDVHPDNLDKCVTLFMESVTFAGLGEMNGDEIVLTVAAAPLEAPASDFSHERGDEQVSAEGQSEGVRQQPAGNKRPVTTPATSEHPPSGRSVIHLNIDLDSSLDTEKLERQLELLRRYGAI